MIAVLERSGLYHREWPQGLNRSAGDHAFVFSRARNIFSYHLVTRSGKERKALVAIAVNGLAHRGSSGPSIERVIDSYAPEGVLVENAARRVTAGRARYFPAGRRVGLGERNRIADARPTGCVIVSALLW